MFISCDFTVCVFLILLITASNGLLFFPLHVWVRLFLFFLITLKYVYFLMHLCFFVDPPPVDGILLFPLHVWVRLRFLL